MKQPVTKDPFEITFRGDTFVVEWREGNGRGRWGQSYFAFKKGVPFLVNGIVSFRPVTGRWYWPEGVCSGLEEAIVDELVRMQSEREERVRVVVDGEREERVRVVVDDEDASAHDSEMRVMRR